MTIRRITLGPPSGLGDAGRTPDQVLKPSRMSPGAEGEDVSAIHLWLLGIEAKATPLPFKESGRMSDAEVFHKD